MLRLLAALAVLLPACLLSATSQTNALSATAHTYLDVGAQGRPALAVAYTPAEFRSAYRLPTVPAGTTGQVIGIVDAFDSPQLQHDLTVYDQRFGLPACNATNGCLRIVGQDGGSTLPASESDWGFEISLDVEISHAICERCQILLVEATTNGTQNLLAAEDTAARLGATEISNSWGSNESPGLPALEYPGIAVVASSGDSGYGTSWPASSPHVIAAGGTTLTLNPDGSRHTETAWKNAGSGCSENYLAPSWQTALPGWHRTHCGTQRAVADISADADPHTGALVYDSNPDLGGTGGWWMVGGTSLSSPLIASMVALAGGVPAGVTWEGQWLYTHRTDADHKDIRHGSNGPCGTSICNAGRGFDGPTGLGVPKGLAWFGGAS